VGKQCIRVDEISRILPMVSHADHTEHDWHVLITEQGVADLRGLSPRERARAIIKNCAHPQYKPILEDYFQRACAEGGHTPHLIDEVFQLQARFKQTGNMLS
jgi:acyl-CoA hydrolase